MKELIFGVMTGTSMDAFDVCILEMIDGHPHKLMDFSSRPFSPGLKKKFNLLITEGANELERSQLLSIEYSKRISQIINQMIKRNKLLPKNICGVGVHGQTIRHCPEKNYTIQICNPSIISQMTELNVVSDFRSRDIAAYGEGAPLAPLFHLEITRKHTPCAVVNIGGISNLTLVEKNIAGKSKIHRGFDTGPGNCLSDLWCRKNFNVNFDKYGNFAKSGYINNELLKIFLSDSFFQLSPPKSTGIHYFNEKWLVKRLASLNKNISARDIQSTIIELTARSICKHLKKKYQNLFLCGGGIKNTYLVERLKVNASLNVMSTEKIGWKPQTLESACFAWIAYKTLNNESVYLKSITGSKKPIKLGNITLY